MKSWSEENDAEWYSLHNERKFVIDERLIRTLKNKIHKHMILISKNVYIDELDDMINKCNNTYHRTVKIKPVDVKSSTYIKSSKEVNHQGPKFKIGGIIRISQYKNIFSKAMFLIGLKKFFCD